MKMYNRNKYVITHLIHPILKHYFSHLKIRTTACGVAIFWDKDGILYSCNNSTDTNKYICELSYINKNQALCQYDNRSIFYIKNVEQMISEFYRAYYKYKIMYKLFFINFSFLLKNKVKKKTTSLMTRSFYQLSSNDLLNMRQFYIICS